MNNTGLSLIGQLEARDQKLEGYGACGGFIEWRVESKGYGSLEKTEHADVDE